MDSEKKINKQYPEISKMILFLLLKPFINKTNHKQTKVVRFSALYRVLHTLRRRNVALSCFICIQPQNDHKSWR